MEVENILAKNLTMAGENAAYDAACKRLLANKIILAWIMKSCIKEYNHLEVNEIADRYIEGNPQIGKTALHPDESEQIRGSNTEDSTISEGTVTYDIRFLAIVPNTGETISLIINVEAQNDFYPGYPIIKRGIYYCSRMISSQYGVEFTNSHYENIKKVYSIWVCANPPQKRKNTINRYFIKEENLVGSAKEETENYDLITAVVICLGHSEDDEYAGVLKLLDVLLSSEKAPEEKKQILQDDFDIKMTRTLESEVQSMCNLSKGIEEKGIQKGLQEGRQAGMIDGILVSVKNLMDSMGWSAEQAMNVLKVSKEDQEKYSVLLKKQ